MHWVHLLSGRPLVRTQPGVPEKRAWHMPGPFLLFVLWYALCPARIFEDAASDADEVRRTVAEQVVCGFHIRDAAGEHDGNVQRAHRLHTDILCAGRASGSTTCWTMTPTTRWATRKKAPSRVLFCMFVPAHSPSFASMASQTSSMSPTMP